jgi:hypothetical protein
METAKRKRPSQCNPGCNWHVVPAEEEEKYYCEDHGGQFPCQEVDCGHGDCVSTRGYAICSSCGSETTVSGYVWRAVHGMTKAFCGYCAGSGA